jgi:Fe2+ transport system protein FeoA
MMAPVERSAGHPQPSRRRPSLPLSLVAAGEVVEVMEVKGSEKQRLQELGLLPGAIVQVVKSDAAAGLIVAVRHDGRLAIGRSAAHNILVCMKETRT